MGDHLSINLWGEDSTKTETHISQTDLYSWKFHPKRCAKHQFGILPEGGV